MKSYCLAILLAATFYVSLSAQELSPTDQVAADAVIKVIRPEAIAAHMRFLSDALLEGRGTGERGHEIAARYVASELEAMGLAPAGVNGTWFEPLQLRKAELIPEQTSFELVREGKSTMLARDRDYIIYANLLQTDATVNAGAVFVGYGVTAPEFQYDDYADSDVKGKVAVVLRRAPARFPSTEQEYFASALTMQQNAAAHGAIGVIVIDSPELLQAQWNRVMPNCAPIRPCAGSTRKALPPTSFQKFARSSGPIKAAPKLYSRALPNHCRRFLQPRKQASQHLFPCRVLYGFISPTASPESKAATL